MRLAALILVLGLSSCVTVPEVRDVRMRLPFVAAPPYEEGRLGRTYHYLCVDGRRVAARYQGTDWARLQLSGSTTILKGLERPAPDDGSGRSDRAGYSRDDVTWHRHGAEAILENGAFSGLCRLDAPGVAAAPTRGAVIDDDTRFPGHGKF